MITSDLQGLPITQSLSENVDMRTLHEVYLWPFVEAVNAGIPLLSLHSILATTIYFLQSIPAVIDVCRCRCSDVFIQSRTQICHSC